MAELAVLSGPGTFSGPSSGHHSRKTSSIGDPRTRSAGTGIRKVSYQERRTAPDEYNKPIVRSAARRWKRLHEQKVMGRINDLRHEKKQFVRSSRDSAKSLARKIPTELLAKEWLNDNEATLEIRAYLVDKLFPTLILGLEKLLNEVDGRDLTEKNFQDPNFNPVNRLAQYLLRNNPRYSNFSEASPYVRGIREVAEDLRRQLFSIDDNRLARVKADARRKREERQLAEKIKEDERVRRQNLMLEQFSKKWTAQADERVELCMLTSAMKSFSEIIDKQLSDELKDGAQITFPFDVSEDSARTLPAQDFAEFVCKSVQNMTNEVFEQFHAHMETCAEDYKESVLRENRRVSLTNLFLSCDHSGIGILDRHRIIKLLEDYYDNMSDSAKRMIRNPRTWPVVEIEEGDDSISDAELDEAPESLQKESQSVEELKSNDSVVSQNMSGESIDDLKKQYTIDTIGSTVKSEETDDKITSDLKKEDITDVTPSESQEEKSEDLPDASAETSNENVAEKDTTEPQDSSASTSEEKAVTSESSEKATMVESETSLHSTQSKDSSQGQPIEEKSSEVISEDGKTDAGARTVTSGSAKEMSVKFSEGVEFERPTTEKSATTVTRSQSQMSTFDESSLNVSQFVQLIETFMGNPPQGNIMNNLTKFMKDGYVETEKEKMQRLLKARKDALISKRKLMVDQLFEKWDNDGSGFLDMEEVEGILLRYKEGQETEPVERAKNQLQGQTKYMDNKLTKREFRNFISLIIDEIPGAEAFDFLMEFLNNSVERTYAERVRGEARKKWLHHIVQAAQTSGGSLEPVYKAMFQALNKDSEAHAGGKKMSASVSMLEHNTENDDGELLLRYVATTPEDADFMLNKAHFESLPGISFAAVTSGKPIHVPRVSNHGNIFFWNTTRKSNEREGSLIVIPLKDRRKRVFGIFGIDTLIDPHKKAIFITHEIQFFQGIAKSFSVAYHYVDMRRKLLRIIESAVSWIHRRSPSVTEIIVYMVEPDLKGEDYTLRKMMTTNIKGNAVAENPPPRCGRKDNLFRDYLYKCVDNSETVAADAYGNRHLAFPLRDDDGRTVAIIDICIGNSKQLPAHENKEVQRMLRLLTMAHREIAKELDGEDKTMVLDAEKNEESRLDVMFDRLMLMELRENVSKLDTQSYAELKSYQEPPKAIHNILKATLAVFMPDEVEKGEFNDWTVVKSHINSDLCLNIAEYDPTSKSQLISPEKVEVHLRDVPHGEVVKHGSLPAQHMYNWVFVCLSLIEHTIKMRANSSDNILGSKLSSGVEDDPDE